MSCPPQDSPHYPFFVELINGGRVWRDDKLNQKQEWLTLDHPRIDSNPANVCLFGYSDLSLPLDQRQVEQQGKYRRHTATRQQWDKIEGDEGWGSTEIRKALLDLQCSVELLNELNTLSGKPSILDQSINNWPDGQVTKSDKVKSLCEEALKGIAHLERFPPTYEKLLKLEVEDLVVTALQKAIEML